MSRSKEIKNKIKSISSTQKITHAMEMLSASKMKKAQDIMRGSRPFAKTIIELINNVAYNYNEPHDFFKQTNEANIGLIIISTDRGLCGGLNINLFRKCYNWIKTYQPNNLKPIFKLATIGEKAKLFAGGKLPQYKIIASQEKIGEHPKMQQLIGVIQVLLQEYKNHQIDSIYIAYNEFKSTLQQNSIIKKLLPIRTEELIKPNKLPTEYLFEPDPKKLLELLLERYIESLIYQGVVENLASEQSARMLAMKNATENANQIIEDLNLNYNKERQMLITKEIAEIVSGSAAV